MSAYEGLEGGREVVQGMRRGKWKMGRSEESAEVAGSEWFLPQKEWDQGGKWHVRITACSRGRLAIRQNYLVPSWKSNM